MTGAERKRLRSLVDQARRRQVTEADRRDGARKRCTGCGGVLYEYTLCCRHCSERRSSRARRARAETSRT